MQRTMQAREEEALKPILQLVDNLYAFKLFNYLALQKQSPDSDNLSLAQKQRQFNLLQLKKVLTKFKPKEVRLRGQYLQYRKQIINSASTVITKMVRIKTARLNAAMEVFSRLVVKVQHSAISLIIGKKPLQSTPVKEQEQQKAYIKRNMFIKTGQTVLKQHCGPSKFSTADKMGGSQSPAASRKQQLQQAIRQFKFSLDARQSQLDREFSYRRQQNLLCQVKQLAIRAVQQSLAYFKQAQTQPHNN